MCDVMILRHYLSLYKSACRRQQLHCRHLLYPTTLEILVVWSCVAIDVCQNVSWRKRKWVQQTLASVQTKRSGNIGGELAWYKRKARFVLHMRRVYWLVYIIWHTAWSGKSSTPAIWWYHVNCEEKFPITPCRKAQLSTGFHHEISSNDDVLYKHDIRHKFHPPIICIMEE